MTAPYAFPPRACLASSTWQLTRGVWFHVAIIHATSHDARIYVSRAGDAKPNLIAESSYFDPIPLPEIVSRADAHVGGRSAEMQSPAAEILDGRVRDVMYFDVALEVRDYYDFII